MSEVDKFLDSYDKKANQAAAPTSAVDDLMKAAPAQDKGMGGLLRDAGLSLAKGVVAVPEAAVGLADIATGGRVGKVLENEGGAVGFRPKQAKEFLGDLHTEKYKDQQRQFQEADGILEKTGVALSNPSMIANAVVESVPVMGMGGVMGRAGLAAGRGMGAIANPTTAAQAARQAAFAGAAGEGVSMAGSQAEAIRQETADGLLTPTQSGAAALTGVIGTAVGAGSARLARYLGIGDADTMLAQGASGMAKQFADDAATAAVNAGAKPTIKSIPRKMIEGAITEGFLEELPQSMAETVLQNLALGKPWHEKLDEAAVMGVLTGGAMGAGAAGFHGFKEPTAAPGAGVAAVAGAPAPLMIGNNPEPLVAFPDGTVGRQADIDAYLNTLPEDQRTTARAKLLNLGPQAVSEEVSSPELERLRQSSAEQLAVLQSQEVGEPVVPQTAPPDGAAVLAERAAVEQAARDATQAESRAVQSPDDEILQSTGMAEAPLAQRPSERMGLDPNAGSMSAAAAIAVDSGATDQMAQMTQAQAQAKQEAKGGKKPAAQPQGTLQAAAEDQPGQRALAPPVLSPMEAAGLASTLAGSDLAKVSIDGADAEGLQAKLQEVQRRAAENGSWNVPLMAQRRRIEEAMANLQQGAEHAAKAQVATENVANFPQSTTGVLRGHQADQTQQTSAQPTQEAAAPDATAGLTNGTTTHQNLGAQAAPAGGTQGKAPRAAAEQLTAAQERWQRMSTAERQAVAARTDVKPILRKNLHGAKWENLNVDVQRKLQRAMEPIEAQPSDMKAFKPETGTLGVPRSEMPQVPSQSHGGLVKHLNSQGISHETTTVDAGSLKPTQAEYSPAKVDAAKGAEGGRAVIVSNDGHIIDGHHQAMAAAEEGKPVKAIVLDAPVDQALDAVRKSPSAQKNDLNQAPALDAKAPEAIKTVAEPKTDEADAANKAVASDVADSTTAAPASAVQRAPVPATEPKKPATTKPRGVAANMAEAAEKARADYFTPGNVIKSYGGHDRVVSYLPPDADGRWSVTVRAVRTEGGKLVDIPGARERTHATPPDARELKAGPVLRAPKEDAQGLVEGDAAEPANDRDTFTLQRMNQDTRKLEPVTFVRGEYVRHKLGHGEIDGISQARSEFRADGVWQPFGFAYKAERLAAPNAVTVPLSSVIDAVNAKNGQGLTDADRVPEQKPASKTPTIDRHNAIMAAVREGKATAEEFRASFDQVVDGKVAIVAELDAMTKAQLLREGGAFVQMRYANEKKADVVDAVYREMVGEYALGETVTYSMGVGAYEAAVRKMVEATDAEKLTRYATERAAAIAENQARRVAKAAAIANPQTLNDFRDALNAKIREGMNRKEAFLTLTPEQRIQYDTLEAESTREARETRKRTQKTQVRAAGQTTAGEIVATKHTRDGYDLFVVKLADRLGADDYKTVLASAKRLGGWYSAFRGNGAIPGFQFKDKVNAEAFLALAGGDTTAAQDQAVQRRDAFEDDRSQTAVERLRAMADKLESQAQEVEGRDRKANTERRARFASAALQSAAADKAKAQTMRNIAQAIEDGNAKFLDEIRTKSQVDMLTGIVDTAKGAELRAKHQSYADQEKRKGEPPTAETADFADFPSYSAFRSDLATLGRQMLEVDGTKKLGQRLLSVADDVTDSYLEFAKANFRDVSQFGRGDSLADFASKDEAERAIKRSGLTGKAIVLPVKRGQNRVILSPGEAIGRGVWKGDGDKRITLTAEFGAEMVEAIGRRGNKQNQLSVPWQFQTAYDRRKALARIGIETPSEFRAALREFIDLKEQAIANRMRELELQMVGRKADGLDFFPTSAEVADQMIEAADLAPDMAVLEPSAGTGHLADRIREAGAEPDVIEISSERRALLEEKGYTTQAVDDFLDLKPRGFFTFGDTFRAPDGAEGIMRGANGNRARLVSDAGDMVGAGYYDRSELTGVAHNGTASGYDRIIMNPPFSNRRDAEHVRHAFDLLKPGGRIVAIMGEGVFFGQDKKAQDFREWLEAVGGTSEKLPEGSFMDPSLPVNTGVNARMVVIDKPVGDAVFSTVTQKPAKGLTVQRTQDIADRVTNHLGIGPVAGLQVFGEPGEAGFVVPASVVPQGATRNGKVYLFAANISDEVEAFKVVVHELFHLGLSKSVPQGAYIQTMLGYLTDPQVRQYANRWKETADGVSRKASMPANNWHALAVEESLADLAEEMHAERQGGGTRLQGWAARMASRMATLAERMGMAGVAGRIRSFTRTEAEQFVQEMLSRSSADVEPLLRNTRFSAASTDQIDTSDDGAQFARAKMPADGFTPAARKQAVQAVEKTAVAIRAAWANGPEVVVAFDMNDPVVPDSARRADLKQRSGGARGAPEGFYYRGKVYLMASRLNTPADAARVLFHEALGHHGLRGAFGGSLAPILNQIATMRKKDVDAKIREYGLRGVNSLDRRAAAEEVLAEMAQNTPTIGFVRRAVAAIRTWLRKNVPGFGSLRLTDNEIIRNFILPARQFVERGGPGGGGVRSDAAFSRGVDDGPMFSRSKVAGLTSKATAELNRNFNVPGKLNWWHKSIGTMYNLAERSPEFKPVFEAAQGFVDDVSHYATDAAELAPKLLPKLEDWKDITKSPVSAADNKAVAKPVFEGTLMWARDAHGKPVRVVDLEEKALAMTADQKAQELLARGEIDPGMLKAWQGMPMTSYENAINSRYQSRILTAGVVWTDAELKDMFKLTDGQIGLYKEFRAATNRSLDTMARADMLRFGGDDLKPLRSMVMDAPDVHDAAKILRDHLAELARENPDRADQYAALVKGINDRADKVAELQGQGYAPLSRFGRYTVDVVVDGNREYFGLFETQREANDMAAKMRQEFGDASVSQGTMSNEAFKLFAGITPESLELFGNMLGLDSTGDDAQDKAFQEYLRLTKTNRSAMKRLIHRKGIAGYSEDIGRVLASFVYSNSRQTAAGLNMGDLGEAVSAIPQNMGELKDAAIRLAEYVKNPQEEAQAIRGLLFAQYLGGSIASAFVNMSQPVAVTFPWLSQFGGAKQAATELTRAAKQMATKGFAFEPGLARALHDAEEDGTVSPQEVHQLMAQASGRGSLKSGDGTRTGDAKAAAQNGIARLSVAWGKVFGAAEQVNRRMTFIAAYRVAVAQGHASPSAFAKKAVTETQFLYSKANKMQFARGAIGGTLMTFKTYSVAYLELLHRMYTQGGPEGKKAALLALGMLMLMGGAGGLPFMEDAEDVADALAQMLGYNFSSKRARQELLEEMLPKGIADFIDKGVSGLPGAPLDVSGRLGMGNLIPGTGVFLEKTSHTRDVMEIAGPMGDFATRILSGTRKALTGDIGGAALEVSPTAVRNAAKGVDMATTGMYRDAKGYKVLDTNTLEAALKSIGFQPASVATVQEANGRNQQAKNFYNLQAQEIRSKWARGIFEDKQSVVDEARADIADWNRKNPDQPMLITVPSVMSKVREMRKPKDQRIADSAPKAMRAQMREELQRPAV